jgi:hypothetical protein
MSMSMSVDVRLSSMAETDGVVIVISGKIGYETATRPSS